MGSIVISDFASLDGVVQDPTGEEGFGRGGWFGRIAHRPEAGKVTLGRGPGRRGPAAW